MFAKLKKKDGMTMALALVIASAITAVSLAISALIATVAVNQVNTAKKNFLVLNLKNQMYCAIEDSLSDPTFRKLLIEEDYNSTKNLKVIVKEDKSGVIWKTPDTLNNLGLNQLEMKIDGYSASKPEYYEYLYNAADKISYVHYIDKNMLKNDGVRDEYVVSSKKIEEYKFEFTMAKCTDFLYGDADTNLVRCLVEYDSLKTNYSILEMETKTWDGDFYFK